ncbi:MAG: GDYXXLXY domain-containing protein [Burkholderiaceae bacterium]
MNQTSLNDVLHAAIEQRVLPPGASAPAVQSERPWPVVLLTSLGAWLAAIPLLGVVGMLLGDLILRHGGAYVIGPLLLALAVVMLRSRDLPLFVEQLAIPALLTGAGTLGHVLFRDLGAHAGPAALALIALGIAFMVRGEWLRVLLGAAAALLCAMALGTQGWDGSGPARWWWPWHGVFGAWLLASAGLRAASASPATLAAQSFGTGWLLATLAGLALWSGMSFLVGAQLGGNVAAGLARHALSHGLAERALDAQAWLSAALALAAAAWCAYRWPGLRRLWLAGVAAVCVVLAWFMPSLGAVWLAVSVCAAASRWRLAASAALAAAWIIGAFYYQLAWPLGTKAVVLAAAGAVLGALAWQARAGQASAQQRADARAGSGRGPAWGTVGLAASVMLTLIAANLGIWQKERLIAQGQPVYVELAPVDPRSLMQGDYMRLNFRVPAAPGTERLSMIGAERPHAIARRDARGVATLVRIDRGEPLGADEMRIELTPKSGGWILVSDAWYFTEGEAGRWGKARYGEFRVEPGGRALLVGLRGANLEAL